MMVIVPHRVNHSKKTKPRGEVYATGDFKPSFITLTTQVLPCGFVNHAYSAQAMPAAHPRLGAGIAVEFIRDFTSTVPKSLPTLWAHCQWVLGDGGGTGVQW
jgi:hypothetical protein